MANIWTKTVWAVWAWGLLLWGLSQFLPQIGNSTMWQAVWNAVSSTVGSVWNILWPAGAFAPAALAWWAAWLISKKVFKSSNATAISAGLAVGWSMVNPIIAAAWVWWLWAVWVARLEELLFSEWLDESWKTKLAIAMWLSAAWWAALAAAGIWASTALWWALAATAVAGWTYILWKKLLVPGLKWAWRGLSATVDWAKRGWKWVWNNKWKLAIWWALAWAWVYGWSELLAA